jgi:hypothetical protein
MACYKCGQTLDCIFDDDEFALSDATKSSVTTFMRSSGGLCKTNGGTRTASGQQNCDTVQFGFTSQKQPQASCCLSNARVGVIQCPIRGQALSNFGTYTVTFDPNRSNCPATAVNVLATKCDGGTCSYGSGFNFDNSCSGAGRICNNF